MATISLHRKAETTSWTQEVYKTCIRRADVLRTYNLCPASKGGGWWWVGDSHIPVYRRKLEKTISFCVVQISSIFDTILREREICERNSKIRICGGKNQTGIRLSYRPQVDRTVKSLLLKDNLKSKRDELQLEIIVLFCSDYFFTS